MRGLVTIVNSYATVIISGCDNNHYKNKIEFIII